MQRLRLEGCRLKMVSVVGHTDTIGGFEANRTPSRARARSRRLELVKQ
jgi:outer membrane protein OmpA-like peptidoglycan-associated protein